MSERALTLAEVAVLAGAEPPPATLAGVPIRRVSGLARATADALVFAEDDQSLAKALRSGAGAILAGAAGESAGDPRVLRVPAPRYAFALCARELARDEAPAEPEIHPSAFVDPTARLGRGTRIGAGARVLAGALLGEQVMVGPNAVILEDVVLGDRVVVQAGAVLGSRGFGYVRHAATGEYLLFPQEGLLIVEDDVEIGANTTIDRGALDETRIGRGTKIDNLVHIGHNCRIGRDVVIAAQVGISGSCVVEDGAVLAGQVGISDHCHIGPGVILGGQAGVYRGKTVTGPGEIFAGTPAEPLRDQMKSLARLRRLGQR
jgi:UDP-3-O-[3-hydroxymyristoyl] glucosamine N-acyltransferase